MHHCRKQQKKLCFAVDECKVLKIGTSRQTDHSVNIDKRKLDIPDEFRYLGENPHQKVRMHLETTFAPYQILLRLNVIFMVGKIGKGLLSGGRVPKLDHVNWHLSLVLK